MTRCPGQPTGCSALSYQSDPHAAIRLAIEAARDVPRVLAEPPPNCLLVNFGDSTIDLELRCWISDPANGTANLRSALMLRIWDLYQANNIELPNPQRDITLRNPAALAEFLRRDKTSPTIVREVAARQRRG